jgi:hypothetical protein
MLPRRYPCVQSGRSAWEPAISLHFDLPAWILTNQRAGGHSFFGLSG